MIKGVTHFTSQAAAASIFNGWLRELTSGENSKRQEPREVRLRLYSRSGMNDPVEQVILEYGLDRIHSKRSHQYRDTVPDDAFLMCGTKPQEDEKGELINRLDMWRAYGDDGRGVAITTWWDDERLTEVDGLEIIEVKYISEIESIRSDVAPFLDIQKNKSLSRTVREEARKSRMRLEVSQKHEDYKFEEEVRLACFLGDESGAILGARGKEIRLDATIGKLRTYIERPVQVGVGCSLTKIDVTLGPRLTDNEARHWEKVSQWVLSRMGLSPGMVGRSELQYTG